MTVSTGNELVGGASMTPDNDVFVHLAKVYSHSHASMHQGDRCEDSRPFLDGITNGYQWYPLAGQHVEGGKRLAWFCLKPHSCYI